MRDFQILAGWKVYSRDVDSAQISRLESYLTRIATLLPGPVLSIVQLAKIYAHNQSKWEEKEGVMTFHWCTNHLKENGRDFPDAPVAGSIEIHNIGRLLDMLSWWPGSLAHDLGHAFHYHTFSNTDHEIKAVFQESIKLPCYNQPPHYAVSNQYDPLNSYKEYWACLFASYFDNSDSYPFNREDIRLSDPNGHVLIERLTTNL